MKRKTFKSLLFRNLAVSIVAAILFIVVTACIALKVVLIIFEKNFVIEQNRLIKYYQQRYLIQQQNNPEDSEEELLNSTYDFIQCELATGFDYVPLDVLLFSSGALYNQETGEKIADSHKIGYIEIIDNETHAGQILFCHESKLDELKEVMHGKNHYPLIEPVVRDYYERGGRRYLGQVDFYADYGDGELLESIDFRPEEPGAYELIEVDNYKYTAYGPSCCGYDMWSEEYVQLERYANEGHWFHDTSDGFEYEINGFVISGMGTKTFILPDGTSLRVFDRANVDLYMYYGKWIIAYCITVPVVAMLIALCCTYLRYIKLRAMYTMEDYRRTLTDSMAHDLKSPLMAISGYAENLKENVNTEKKEHYAESIINNVQYMNDIISNILQLSRLESGTIKLNKENLELKNLIEQNLEKYEEVLSENNLKIKMENSVIVKGDVKLLSQALDNLISNAVKYSEPDSVIEIIAEDNIMSGAKKITFSNSCNEQPDVSVQDLWKPFVKADNSRSNQTGTGIGLTIAKNIFEMHGFKQKLFYEEGRFIVEIQLN